MIPRSRWRHLLCSQRRVAGRWRRQMGELDLQTLEAARPAAGPTRSRHFLKTGRRSETCCSPASRRSAQSCKNRRQERRVGDARSRSGRGAAKRGNVSAEASRGLGRRRSRSGHRNAGAGEAGLLRLHERMVHDGRRDRRRGTGRFPAAGRDSIKSSPRGTSLPPPYRSSRPAAPCAKRAVTGSTAAGVSIAASITPNGFSVAP